MDEPEEQVDAAADDPDLAREGAGTAGAAAEAALSGSVLEAFLHGLPDWRAGSNSRSLVGVFTFDGLGQALAFTGFVAVLAALGLFRLRLELAGEKVHVTLVGRQNGGVTPEVLELAKEIGSVAKRLPWALRG